MSRITLLAVLTLILSGCEPTSSNTSAPTTPAPTGSSATGSSATGSSATGSSATGSSATGSSAAGSSATGASAVNDDSSGASAAASDVDQAVCQLQPIGESGVSGTIRFTRSGETVQVQGTITGLTPGKHGFHVHETGDVSDTESGQSAGGHYNPTDQPHGRPGDSERHVGDLGNIEANAEGTAEVDMEDSVIQLNGPHSIVGRALMVHAGEDKFTQPSGDAGSRVAFGVIEATDGQ